MNSRQNEIIRYLFSKDTSITSKELAYFFGVSNRTIINDIKTINQYYDNPIILSTKHGYIKNIDANFDLDIKANEGLELQNRIYFIVTKLLISNEEVNIYDLAEELSISDSLLRKDLVYFNKEYKRDNLKIVSNNNYIDIVGSETNRRNLIMKILKSEDFEKFITNDHLSEVFGSHIVKVVTETLNELQKEFNFYINDFSRTNIIMHLLIIISRIKHGHRLSDNTIELAVDFNESVTYISDKYINTIQKILNITFDQEEITEIRILFEANINVKNFIENYEYKENIQILTEFLKEVFNDVSEKYYVNFFEESSLLNFTLHIHNLIFRVNNNKKLVNPLAATLKKSFPLLYDIAIFIYSRISKEYNISSEVDENEISFIALHLGLEVEQLETNSELLDILIYSPEYLNIPETLYAKIESNFSNELNTLHIIDSLDLLGCYNFDLLITTIEVKDIKLSKKTITISPFFNTNDIIKIKSIINEIQTDKKIKFFKLNLDVLFNRDLFFIEQGKLKDKYEIIKLLSNALSEQGYVDDNFYAKVIERENAISTGYEGFAIPHTVTQEANKNIICVYLSTEGINWDENNVHVVFLIAMSKDKFKELQLIFEGLMHYLTETSIVMTLKDCKDFDKFIFTFKNE